MILQGMLILFATAIMLLSLIGSLVLYLRGERSAPFFCTLFATLIVVLVMFKILFTGEYIL